MYKSPETKSITRDELKVWDIVYMREKSSHRYKSNVWRTNDYYWAWKIIVDEKYIEPILPRLSQNAIFHTPVSETAWDVFKLDDWSLFSKTPALFENKDKYSFSRITKEYSFREFLAILTLVISLLLIILQIGLFLHDLWHNLSNSLKEINNY